MESSEERCQALDSLGSQMLEMAKEIGQGLETFGMMSQNGEVFMAYEADGYGSQLFMDDANIPSLLSLPYLGVLPKDDPVYLATRKRLLDSQHNKYFFEGEDGRGIGGVHAGADMIWPMSIIIQGLTSSSKAEVKQCLQLILSTTADTWMIHESFNKDDASQFTRPEFGWANSLFAEFVMHIHDTYPDLL